MTKARSFVVPQWLVARVKVWQRRCDLESWEIILSMRNLPGRTMATTTYVPGYKSCRMEFDPGGYAACNETEVDRRIAHEMYHLLAAHMEDVLTDHLGQGKVLQSYSNEQEHLAETFGAIMVKAYRRKKVEA